MLVRLIDTLIDPIAPISFTQLGFRLRSELNSWDTIEQSELHIAVTGPTSGLGKQLAIELDSIGANLVLIARNQEKLDDLVKTMVNGDKHSTIVCDLTDPGSVKSACSEICKLDQLDVLVHNAGTIFDSYKSIEGSEQTLFSHVIAPYALSQAATELLSRSETGRIIYVASGGLYTQAVTLDDLTNAKTEDFNGTRAYAKAKRIQTIVASQAAKEPSGPIQLAVHPGWVDTPGLEKLLPGFHKALKPVLRSPSSGVDTIKWLCTTETRNLNNGAFYFDRRPRSTSYIPGTKTDITEAAKIYQVVRARADSLVS